jgi:hypothetical protein
VFRTGKDAAESRYDPYEINAYRITGGKYYISATVEAEGEKKQVFLEYLVNGMADLYYLREDNSETYYIRKEGEEAIALTDIRLLKAAFSDCYEIQSSLDNATLSHKSLVNMTVKYHDYVCDGEECINYSKDASGLRLRVAPLVAYTFSSFSFQGGARPFDLFEFPNYQAPVFGAVLDLQSVRLGEHISFQLGAEFSKISLQTTAREEGVFYYVDYSSYDVHLESGFFTFKLGTKYTFSRNRVRPSLGGGLEISKFISPDFYYVEDIYLINWEEDMESNSWAGNPMKNPLYGVYVQAGLDVKLSEKLTLVSAMKAGYQNSNPNTVIALRGGEAEQARVRTRMIPVTVLVGILF